MSVFGCQAEGTGQLLEEQGVQENRQLYSSYVYNNQISITTIDKINKSITKDRSIQLKLNIFPPSSRCTMHALRI
jgi:hypothetical protein